MHQTCRQCQSEFEITDADLAFYDKVSPIFNGKKELIPAPTLCPDCRQQRRWAFQNQRFLYKRKSDATGKEIVSAYSPEKPFKVYEKAEWLKVDNTEFGREFDFDRPFFEQFNKLFHDTIKENVSQSGEMINSEYVHFAGWHKNSYLVFDAGKCEDCMYGTFMGYCKNCVDVLDMQRNELCYDCVDMTDCYGMFHSTFCKNCNSSAFLFDCIGCKNCIGCTSLRNKEYCVFNQFVGKEEFEKTWNGLFDGSHATREAARNHCQEFMLSQPRRALHNTNAPNSTGDYLINCENTKDCFKCLELRDAKFCQYVVLGCNDLYDISAFGESMSFCYELSASGGIVGKIGETNCCFDAYMYYGGDSVYYSINTHDNSKNLFGCADLRGKQYCILNKQYTKEEYDMLVPKIIAHMRSTQEYGEFFPITLSPFAYNETLALTYYPLTQEEVLSKGWNWKDRDQRDYQPSVFQIPDRIADVEDSITKETLSCVDCTKNYRIVTQELEFYRNQSLPIPRLCPDCRYLTRVSRRNPQTLWNRECGKCQKPISTSYSPDRPEIVYCEQCYLESVY